MRYRGPPNGLLGRSGEGPHPSRLKQNDLPDLEAPKRALPREFR